MYMVWGQVCGAAIRCLQTQVVNSIIRYSSGEEGMLQHSITNHSCPVDATTVGGGDGGRDQGLRRRHLTSRARAHRPFEHFDATRAGRGVSPLDAPQIARMSVIAGHDDREREKERYCTLQANFLHVQIALRAIGEGGRTRSCRAGTRNARGVIVNRRVRQLQGLVLKPAHFSVSDF